MTPHVLPRGELSEPAQVTDAWEATELFAAYNDPGFSHGIQMTPLDADKAVSAADAQAGAATSRAASLAHAASETGGTENAGASGALSGLAAGAPATRANRNRRRLLWGIGVGVVAVIIIAVGAGVAAGSKKHPSSGSSSTAPSSVVPALPTATTSSSATATVTSTAVPVPQPTANLAQFVGNYSLTASINAQDTTCGAGQLVGCNPGFLDTAVVTLANGRLSLAPFGNHSTGAYTGTYQSSSNAFLFPDPPATGNTTEGSCFFGATQAIAVTFNIDQTFTGRNLDTYTAQNAGCASNVCTCSYDWSAVKLS